MTSNGVSAPAAELQGTSPQRPRAQADDHSSGECPLKAAAGNDKTQKKWRGAAVNVQRERKCTPSEGETGPAQLRDIDGRKPDLQAAGRRRSCTFRGPGKRRRLDMHFPHAVQQVATVTINIRGTEKPLKDLCVDLTDAA